MEKEKLNIIIVSNEAWGDVWYSKHHYAHELSKSQSVVFINPTKRWKWKNIFNHMVEEKSVSATLKIISYNNILPSKLWRLNNYFVSKRIMRYFKKTGFSPNIFWSFDPIRLYDPKIFGVEKSIFHAVDKYLFSFNSEKLLHLNVDAFVIVAEEFRSQYSIYEKPVLFIPHGIPDEQSNSIESISLPCQNYVLYMGMIDGRLDYPLIRNMVRSFPNETFLFLGDIGNVSSSYFDELFIMKLYKNLIHVPAVHALKLKYYIQGAKCCLAPMKQDWAGNMISHHKILQYLAFGKAVFSPEFSAYHEFRNLLYMENEENELMIKLNSFFENGESEELRKERIALAGQNRYDSHTRKILDFIHQF